MSYNRRLFVSASFEIRKRAFFRKNLAKNVIIKSVYKYSFREKFFAFVLSELCLYYYLPLFASTYIVLLARYSM